MAPGLIDEMSPANGHTSAVECRWAFLGLSEIAQLFVRDLLLPSADAKSPIKHRLAAVSTTRSAERARQWLETYSVPDPGSVSVYTDYESMLKEGSFDVVYVSTPHSVHFKHARAAIVAGRSVLLEKPAVMNSAQYERLAELAKQHGVVLMEAMWTRYFPLTKLLQQDILPRIGPIRRILADYSVPLMDDPDLEPTSRFLDKATGSGSLLDLGVYPLTWVDIALGGTGKALSVKHAESIFHDAPNGAIDDTTTVILSRGGTESPVTAVVTISSSLPGSASLPLKERLLREKNAPSIRIQGLYGEVALPFPPIRPETLKVQYYSPDKLTEDFYETEEVVTREVHGWGLRYQTDIIAEEVLRQKAGGKKKGAVIGERGSVQVLKWVDQAKQMAGITYSDEIEKLW